MTKEIRKTIRPSWDIRRSFFGCSEMRTLGSISDISRRLFLGLAGAVLAGCAVPQARVETPGFEAGAYNYLASEFKRKGLHNLGSPLFDFSDREVREAYERASAQRGLIHNRDFDGAGKIEFEVERHLYLHGNKTLILLSGAAFHIYGAVEVLENRFDAGYISVTPKKINLGDVLESNKIFKYPAESELGKAREMLEIQMRRANGISAEMGYGNLFGFVEKVSSDREAGNVAVGIEETGLHDLYTPGYTARVYDTLGTFLDRFKPRSILFLRESKLFYPDRNREDFLRKAKRLGIPVGIKGFLETKERLDEPYQGFQEVR